MPDRVPGVLEDKIRRWHRDMQDHNTACACDSACTHVLKLYLIVVPIGFAWADAGYDYSGHSDTLADLRDDITYVNATDPRVWREAGFVQHTYVYLS